MCYYTIFSYFNCEMVKSWLENINKYDHIMNFENKEAFHKRESALQQLFERNK